MNLEELAKHLWTIGDSTVEDDGIKEIKELLAESFPSVTSRGSTVHESWWGNYEEVSNRYPREKPLRLVLAHTGPLDLIVSSLKFPADLAGLDLDQNVRSGLVIDEATMGDLRLSELAQAISQTHTKTGYRMLEYFLHFPLRDPSRLAERQEMFRELVTNPQIARSLLPHFQVMADYEDGFVEFVFPQRNSPEPRPENFLMAKKYLAEVPAVLAKLKNAKSIGLAEICGNIEQLIKTGVVRELYDVIINHEVIELAKLDPVTWASSLSDQTSRELQGYTPILAALEHGHITLDFNDVNFRISPRSPDDPVMLNFPLRNLRVNLEAVRGRYFDNRNLIFNLHYLMGVVEAIASLSSMHNKLNNAEVVFPSFDEAEQFAARLLAPADPYLLANNVEVVRNDYEIDGQRRGYVITGPNSGGKTVFAFTLPKLYVLAQVGLPIPAESAQLTIVDHVYTVRPTLHEGIGEGRYMHMLRRSRGVLELVTPKSLVAIDDFEGTDPEDSRLQSLVILNTLIRVGAGVTMTTQDSQVASNIESSVNGAYEGIALVKVDWAEKPKGGIDFFYKVIPGVGRSIGGVVAKTVGMDSESLDMLLQKRGLAQALPKEKLGL